MLKNPQGRKNPGGCLNYPRMLKMKSKIIAGYAYAKKRIVRRIHLYPRASAMGP
jgi:hypothetical protein